MEASPLQTDLLDEFALWKEIQGSCDQSETGEDAVRAASSDEDATATNSSSADQDEWLNGRVARRGSSAVTDDCQ